MANRNRGSLFLLIAAFLWGTTFAAQKLGMESMPPFAFNGVRMLLGSVICFIMYLASYTVTASSTRKTSTDTTNTVFSAFTPELLKGGLACGILLFAASNLQQSGIVYTTPGKAGFITTLYIIIVPLLGIFTKKFPKPIIWFCVILAVTGFYLMCINEDFTLGRGDLLVLICAFAYSFHIIVVDRVAPFVNGIMLSSLQFLVCGSLSLIVSAVIEPGGLALTGISAALFSILYAGIFSCGIAYTFQILGQKDVPPELASLLMSFESVFSIVGGIIVFHEFPAMREGIGCLLVFISVLLAQKLG